MHPIDTFCLRLLAFRISFVIIGACLPRYIDGSQFEIAFYRLENPTERITVRFEIISQPLVFKIRNASPSVHVVMCSSTNHAEPDASLDPRSASIDPILSESKYLLQITRIGCRNGIVPRDVLLSQSNTSLIVYVPRTESSAPNTNNSYVASVMIHNPRQTVIRLNVSVQDRFYRWLLSRQPIYARWTRVRKKSEDIDSLLLTHTPNVTVANLLKQLSVSQTHADRNHVTTVMIYVLLTFFTLFVLTGILGLVGYLIQRLRHVHLKRRCSRHLVLATRKAMKKLPLRTLRPSDIEVSSGYDQCAVCIELYKASDVIRILPCRHFYHKKCIDPWLLEQRSCPLCKLDILKSCGIVSGLSAEDESYLATRLVERDADSVSSTSSSSAFTYPLRWRMKRLWTSVFGKSADPGCDACSLAYLQVMQLDALRYNASPPPPFRSVLSHHGTPHEYGLGRTHLPVSWGQNQVYSSPVELQDNSANCFLSWLCPCLCWRQRNSTTICDPCHPGRGCFDDPSEHTNPFHLDEETTQALHAARLLSYRNSQSTDRLCYYHASAMGVSNVYRVPHAMHWTQYSSHYTTLQHWNNARSGTVHAPLSSTHQSGWRQRFGLKRRGVSTSHPVETNEKQSNRNVGSFEVAECHASGDKQCPRRSGLMEPLMLNRMEQAIVIHHANDDATRNSQHTSPVVANADNGSQYTFASVGKLDERQRLSALPPISVVGTQSSSSSDGSSEPSLVILPPTSIPGYMSPLDQFWTPWYNSAAHIPPPTYLESFSQPCNGMMLRTPTGKFARPQCKIRSRKFRGGYHPYLFSGIGRRRPMNHRSEFKEWLNSTPRGDEKTCRIGSWRSSLSTSMARSERFVNRLSKLFCASRPQRCAPTSSTCGTNVRIESAKGQSPNPSVISPPSYYQATELISRPLSPHSSGSPRLPLTDQTSISWPHVNIICPLCRIELRQVAQHLHEHHRAGANWHRMFHPHHSFKRTAVNAQWFIPCDSFGRKPRHRHHHYRPQSHLQQHHERKVSSTLRTAVHVHSYDLRNPQTDPTSGTVFDGIQTMRSDSSESAIASQLQGVRVTVEPPEVQYHNGPLTSDSSSSPAASDPGEIGSGSDASQPDMTCLSTDPAAVTSPSGS